MRRVLIGTVVSVVAAAGAVVGVQATAGAAAAAPVRIVKVRYDPPGPDTRSNASLNAEWVLLRNVSTRPVTLTGWTLRDAQHHVYALNGVTLGSGRTVYVHTGRGTTSAAHRYWGSGNYVWNNTGDTATLRDPRKVVQNCTWTKTAAGSITC